MKIDAKFRWYGSGLHGTVIRVRQASGRLIPISIGRCLAVIKITQVKSSQSDITKRTAVISKDSHFSIPDINRMIEGIESYFKIDACIVCT